MSAPTSLGFTLRRQDLNFGGRTMEAQQIFVGQNADLESTFTSDAVVQVPDAPTGMGDANFVSTAAQMLQAYFNASAPLTADRTLTTASAADIVTALSPSYAKVGASFEFTVDNSYVGVNHNRTVAGGAGVTLNGNGDVAQNDLGIFVAVVTNAASGSEAVTIQEVTAAISSVSNVSFAVGMGTGATDYVALANDTEVELGTPVSGSWDVAGLGLHNDDGLFGAATGRVTFSVAGKYALSALIEWTGDNVVINPTSGNAKRNPGWRRVVLNQDPAGVTATTVFVTVTDQVNSNNTIPFVQAFVADVNVASLAGGANIFSLAGRQNSNFTQDARVIRFQGHRYANP